MELRPRDQRDRLRLPPGDFPPIAPTARAQMAYLASLDGETVGIALRLGPRERHGDHLRRDPARGAGPRHRGPAPRPTRWRERARRGNSATHPDRRPSWAIPSTRRSATARSAASRCGSGGSRRTPDRVAGMFRPWREGPTATSRSTRRSTRSPSRRPSRETERQVARAAPRLQKILAEALGAGGWFGESHDAEALKAATTPDEEARLTAVRTLLAEEARMGMMVGVAVGWALADQLEEQESEPTKED